MGPDARVPLEILTRLRLKRFHLSIDDFGTGHSSLAQLRDIPFNELKIDQGFVHRAWQDDTLRAIYDASLAMGKQLGMDIVAEGVEDRNDWDLLRQTGCDMAQGNFISEPLLPADLPNWGRSKSRAWASAIRRNLSSRCCRRARRRSIGSGLPGQPRMPARAPISAQWSRGAFR